MILELDLGNTRAKWRILNERAEIIVRGVDDVARWLDSDFPESWFANIQRVRISSVLSDVTEKQLITKMQSELSIAPQLARSESHCCGITNAYATPERLGIDRWLALVAAYQAAGRAVMVVDVGTALKIDATNDAGHHIGGYIIPGAALMERALLDGTDRVRYKSGAQMESVALGFDTRSCVQNGIAAALVGAALVAIEQCKLHIGRQPALYFTGGLGSQMQRCLESNGVYDIRFEADLVMDGLRYALP